MIKAGDKVTIGTNSTDVWTVKSVGDNGMACIVWDDLNANHCHVDELVKIDKFYLGGKEYNLIDGEWVSL